MISKITKTLCSIILCFAIFIANRDYSNVLAQQNSPFISNEEALLIAKIHVGSTILLDKDTENWTWGIRIDEPVVMYDISGKVSAYYCKVKSETDMSLGYVIVGAQDGVAPIVEYATKGEFYPLISMEEMDGDCVIYNGGYSYYIKKDSVYYDVSGFGNSIKIEEDDVKKNIAGGLYEEEHSEEWAEWRKMLGAWSGGSNPPTTGGAITNPYDYETNSMSYIATYVSGFNQTYKMTSSFGGYSNHCAPVAATNLMIYWYYRNQSAYGNVRKYGDTTWGATFLEYYSLMHTNSSGTYSSYLAPAYNTFLYDVGITAVATYKASPTWNYIKNELDAGRPMHVVVYDHYYYGNHSMVTFGYCRFGYSGGFGSSYLRVADGFISTASRYIHTTVGNSDLDVVKVVIA